ncbi:MAG: DUF4258 domain-containing protein [Gallionella sp.]
MFSQRFQKNIRLTHYVKARMEKRDISLEQLLDLIETGDIRHKSETDWWIYKGYAERTDNMVCSAVVVGQAVIVKTVMVNWILEELQS